MVHSWMPCIDNRCLRAACAALCAGPPGQPGAGWQLRVRPGGGWAAGQQEQQQNQELQSQQGQQGWRQAPVLHHANRKTSSGRCCSLT